MSVSQSQSKQATAKTSVVFQLFKSPYFILLGFILVLTISAAAWLYQQQVYRQQQSIVQTQAIVDFTQDAMAVQSVSQDLSALVSNLQQAIKSLDQQMSVFLEAKRFFLVNSVYQEAHYTQAMVIKAYETMAQLDSTLALARTHAHQYQAQSTAYAAHYEHIQQLQNNADTLGRAFFKLSWKFDELIAVINRTLKLVRYNEFEAGIGHYTSVGIQKSAALDSSVVGVGSKLVDWQAHTDKTMDFVQQAVAVNGVKPASSLRSASTPFFAVLASVGLLAMAVVWFYGVLKPRAQLIQQAQALNEGHTSILSMPQGEWGSIAFHMESLAKEKSALQLHNATQSQELERLQLSLLSSPYMDDEPLAINELIASGKQQILPGFDAKTHQVN